MKETLVYNAHCLLSSSPLIEIAGIDFTVFSGIFLQLLHKPSAYTHLKATEHWTGPAVATVDEL